MDNVSRTQTLLTYAAAARMIAAAISHAETKGWAVAVAVVDPSGHVLASGRMDNVPAPVLDFAVDKAYTATLGKTSLAFGERMAEFKSLELGLGTRERLLAWEGGVPVYQADMLIGAIGVSGAAGHEDAACALAAIADVGLTGTG